MVSRGVLRFVVLSALVALAGEGTPAGARPQAGRHLVTLCALKAKPGNSFTFVRPGRPEGAIASGGGATINVTYVGFGAYPGAQTAFQYAVGLWSAQIASPVAIEVQAKFADLADGVLGSAGAQFSYIDVPGAIPTTFYSDGLADRLGGANRAPGEFDIIASFADDAAWYFGTDGNTPAGQYDFVSVVLHELGHGLGFAGSAYMLAPGNVGGIGASGMPKVFDLFSVTETGAAMLGFQNETVALGQQLLAAYNAGDPQGFGVYWGGAAGKAANGGLKPRLYTAPAWSSGSSYSHLDEDTYPEGNANSLMTYQLSAAEAVHDPGPITLGMFTDMGWDGRTELVTNGSFGAGMTGWTPYASVTDSAGVTSQDNSYIQFAVTNGVLEYYRVGPTPPDTATSAVVLQNTGVPFGAGAQLVATFDVGNSSSVRKRISVLIHDQDFSDLSVCTFWVPAFVSTSTYRMVTHTTEAWAGASISFYAASADSNGGVYELDNVSLISAPAAVAAETRCVDPWFPLAAGGADGAEMLSNGGFESGLLPPWQTFGTLTPQIAGGVFEFTRDSSAGAAGVILQPTGQGVAANSIVTARFELGNSSGVRKRVTALLHDLDFTDLSACTFWLEPGQPLRPYLMRAYVTEAWGNATLSVYAATVGTEQWTRFDNASMKVTPGTQTLGAECGEPGSAVVAGRAPIFTPGPIAPPDGAAAAPGRVGAGAPPPDPVERQSTAVPEVPRGTDPVPTAASAAPAVVAPAAVAPSPDAPADPPAWVVIGVPAAAAGPALARIEVSADGITWRTVAEVPLTEDGMTLAIDPALLSDEAVCVRVVFEPARAALLELVADRHASAARVERRLEFGQALQVGQVGVLAAAAPAG